jgi:predicted nucleic acid-binding protein
MDTLIAATAILRAATLVHRDPHFTAIPPSMLKQEMLPPK